MIRRSVSFGSDPTQPGLLEVSLDTFTRFQAVLGSGCSLVLFVAIFPNLFAIYYSAKNNDLFLSVRLVLTAENVQRFVYTIIQMANYLCTSFLATGCSNDGIAAFILNNGRNLLVVNAFCQAFVSFSRFMAVSFDGMLFRCVANSGIFHVYNGSFHSFKASKTESFQSYDGGETFNGSDELICLYMYLHAWTELFKHDLPEKESLFKK
ncbi:unnamed protein product, partial [Mesorhabditis belari]|uniref:Uncharacterized protein n=1 Tax=Mesorhabditis belari TaxID=2138241 RepID=A0AAF3FBF7_9BILA